MARYLTPSKVGLLALISLYTDSLVPTSAAIPILSFIVGNLIPIEAPSSYNLASVSRPRHFITSIQDFEEVCIIHASGIPGRSVWDLLVRRLWDINSFDALHVFFDSLSFLLVKSREEQQKDAEQGLISLPENRLLLSRTSLLGTFVRRAQLEFVRIQFHDAVALWKSFIAYRQPTWSTWRKRNPMANKESFDVNLESGSSEDRLTSVLYGQPLEKGTMSRDAVSTDDVERLLEFQVEEMQSTSFIYTLQAGLIYIALEIGNRMPEDVRAQFRRMLESNVTIPSLSHYVK